ncbi:regulatory protein YcgZ [Pantoea sp.]|uniref:regulatory protein YcgZ n=1 Tax=Pantoea sp. TaxID=69393 RepID=UPI0028978D34|nr:regulatory protein YcgZ [Pantoea sp.]
MPQQQRTPVTAHEISHYFHSYDGYMPTQQETLGQIVAELLRAGKTVNRKAICTKLLAKLELAPGAEMERHYHSLIALVLGRE